MKKNRWLIFFSILTPLLLLIVIFLMGGGHGTYIPADVLFPFGMIGTVFQDEITTPFIILGFIQFPVYGYLLDRTKNNKLKYCIPIIHFVLMIVIFFNTNFK